MKNEKLFEHIRPYSEEETLIAVKKLFNNPDFRKELFYFEDKINIKEWIDDILSCKTQHEFHLAFANRVFHYFVEKSCTHIHYSGIENIDPNTPHLFIGNHRDIILDSSCLQIYFFKQGYKQTRVAIGDNLLQLPIFVEIARIQKMFLVLRSGSLKEKIANTHLLSSYIYHSIFNDKESVWIAQGNGRTKNGDDKTQQGLIKMLTLAAPENPLQMLKQMRITPVTVSYQYEPCAQMKARELALSENAPYIKQPKEDTLSMVEGVEGFKGTLHFKIGKPLQKEFENIPSELSLNEQLTFLCDQIDRQIYENYHLSPQNYIAFDLQDNTDRFSKEYSAEEKTDFLQYLNEKSIVPDVPKEKMRKYLLDIYANSVRNRFKI
jgi:1-acyl-sn-glycerol-3-phosphate acyltransferase